MQLARLEQKQPSLASPKLPNRMASLQAWVSVLCSGNCYIGLKVSVRTVLAPAALLRTAGPPHRAHGTMLCTSVPCHTCGALVLCTARHGTTQPRSSAALPAARLVVFSRELHRNISVVRQRNGSPTKLRVRSRSGINYNNEVVGAAASI